MLMQDTLWTKSSSFINVPLALILACSICTVIYFNLLENSMKYLNLIFCYVSAELAVFLFFCFFLKFMNKFSANIKALNNCIRKMFYCHLKKVYNPIFTRISVSMETKYLLHQSMASSSNSSSSMVDLRRRRRLFSSVLRSFSATAYKQRSNNQ